MKTRILATVILFFISYMVSSNSYALPRIEYEEDLDEVRAAIAAKQVSPVSELLVKVKRQYRARIIRIELEKEDDYGYEIWVYQLKMLDAERNIIKAEFDAKSLRLLAIKGNRLERFLNMISVKRTGKVVDENIGR